MNTPVANKHPRVRSSSLVSLTGLAIAAVCFALLGGCATTQTTTSTPLPPPPPSLSVGDISKLVEEKRADIEIVREIQSKGLKSQLNANDLDLLQKAGASKEVIDAALLARVGPIPSQQQTTVITTGYPYYGYGGYPAYGAFSYGFGLGYGWGYPAYRGYYGAAPRFRGSVGVRAIR